jgi:actin-related protein 9
MAQMYAANSLSGVVVDIGDEKTDITPIYEGFINQQARTTASLGIRDCETYLTHLLLSNQSVISALSPPSNPLAPEALFSTLLELVKQIWREGYIKVPSDGETAAPEDEGVTDIAAVLVAGREKAVIESGMKKKATAKASAAEQARAREIEALDLVTIQFREHSLTLGKERHRFCEPLFDPKLLKGISGVSGSANSLPLQDAVGLAVGNAEVDQRQYVWSGLFVTGDLTRHVKGVLLSKFCFIHYGN